MCLDTSRKLSPILAFPILLEGRITFTCVNRQLEQELLHNRLDILHHSQSGTPRVATPWHTLYRTFQSTPDCLPVSWCSSTRFVATLMTEKYRLHCSLSQMPQTSSNQCHFLNNDMRPISKTTNQRQKQNREQRTPCTTALTFCFSSLALLTLFPSSKCVPLRYAICIPLVRVNTPRLPTVNRHRENKCVICKNCTLTYHTKICQIWAQFCSIFTITIEVYLVGCHWAQDVSW